MGFVTRLFLLPSLQKISAEFGGKYDRHQLRDRWHGQAAQRASRKVGRWSPDEDEKLQKVSIDSCLHACSTVSDMLLHSLIHTAAHIDWLNEKCVTRISTGMR